MASSPAFASTPRVGSGTSPGTIDTSLTGPTNYTSILTGGSSGTKVNEIVLQGIATTSAGIANIFLYDGSNWSLIDQVLVSAVTSSTTAVAFRAVRQYANLVLPSSSWSLRFSVTVGTSQLRATAYGADL